MAIAEDIDDMSPVGEGARWEDADRTTGSGSVARLAVTRILRADPAGLCQAFDEPSWLGRVVDEPNLAPGLRRVETDLAFALSDDPQKLTFRKAAFVDLGRTSTIEGRCIGRVEWRAASLAPLFPVFSGTVTAHDGGLHLEGVYAPPGGGVGLLVDRTFLHHFARRTAIWFLDRLIEELGGPAASERG
jgi:hypothetical protein